MKLFNNSLKLYTKMAVFVHDIGILAVPCAKSRPIVHGIALFLSIFQNDRTQTTLLPHYRFCDAWVVRNSLQVDNKDSKEAGKRNTECLAMVIRILRRNSLSCKRLRESAQRWLSHVVQTS